jgi:HEAT repeat protein
VPDLILEVARFRRWADEHYPVGNRFGEWECDYPDWGSLYMAVLGLVSSRRFQDWSEVEMGAVLYAVARDNEMQHLASEIRSHPGLLFGLAKIAAECGEPDAKWQLAEELGQLGQCDQETEALLVTLASDADEYVRRRSLQALARLHSQRVEELAMKEWHRPDENQQWARMNVLRCLHRVRSSLLEPLIVDAERDERPYLADFAKSVRQGDVKD